ncbi:DUF4094 domain-containing protein, partial [Shewanella sp. A25]|nr:DUF4094 domain-containing protein [Shewanella shenzhenensis]
NGRREKEDELTAGDCNSAKVNVKRDYREILQTQDTHHAVWTLDKTIAKLETELSAARTLQESFLNGSPVSEGHKGSDSTGRQKYLMV